MKFINLSKIFIPLVFAFLLFISSRQAVLGACIECANDHAGICNLYSANQAFNRMVGRYCGSTVCDFYDACSPHTHNDATCYSSNYDDLSTHLQQLSSGEAFHGAFVGCNSNNQGQNCFCDSSGRVHCYDDANSDSCAAKEGGSPNPTSPPGCEEHCPNPNPKDSDLLQNCHPPDSDGTSKDTRCTAKCQTAPCGGKTYYCPSPGGTWTTTPIICCSPAQSCPTTCHTATIQVDDGNCGKISCPANAPAYQNCPSSCHTTSLSLDDGNCGKYTCPPNVPPAQSCPTTCHTATIQVDDGNCGKTTCPPNAPTAGTCPICRTASSTVPDGSCGTTTCAQNCWATCVGNVCNYPPTFSSFTIKNSTDTLVNVDATGKNHICQTIFNGNRIPILTVTASDPDGVSDITSIRLRWNGHEFPQTSFSNGVATFSEDLPVALNNSNSYLFEANITDSVGHTTGWVSTGRFFKIWDCLVNAHGTYYDGSKASFGTITCGAISNEFKDLIGDVNWKTLVFKNAVADKNMDIDASLSKYQSLSNKLIFGKTYTYAFNTDIAAGIPQMRIPNAATCQNTFTVDFPTVDPYVALPDMQIDFSSIKDQDPWFQTTAGGVNAVRNIRDAIPPTCQSTPGCIPVISIENTQTGLLNSNLIFANSIDKGCDTCNYGQPNNWSYSVSRTSLSEDYNYNYFYNNYQNRFQFTKYYDQASINFSTIKSEIGGTGIVIVNGDLNIDTDNALPNGQFLIIVVHKNINISNTVNRIDGLLIADGSITADGVSDTDQQLVINGVLYSAYSNVTLTRGFKTKNKNNGTPAVVVNFQPDYIFNIPIIVPETQKLYQSGI